MVIVKIAVLHKLLPAHPLLGVVLEAVVEEVEALQTQLKMLGKSIVAFLKIFLEVLLIHPCKWRKPS